MAKEGRNRNSQKVRLFEQASCKARLGAANYKLRKPARTIQAKAGGGGECGLKGVSVASRFQVDQEEHTYSGRRREGGYPLSGKDVYAGGTHGVRNRDVEDGRRGKHQGTFGIKGRCDPTGHCSPGRGRPPVEKIKDTTTPLSKSRGGRNGGEFV